MSAAATTKPPVRTSASGGDFAGLGTLIRFALRRDRLRLPLWILGIVLAAVGSAASFPATYPDAEARLGALLTIDNPGTTALIGSVYGDGEYTRSEEHTSELQSRGQLVCRLLLETKRKHRKSTNA